MKPQNSATPDQKTDPPARVGREGRVIHLPARRHHHQASVVETGRKHNVHITIAGLAKVALNEDPHAVIPGYRDFNTCTAESGRDRGVKSSV